LGWKLWDANKTNPQLKVQSEINLYNQEKRLLICNLKKKWCTIKPWVNQIQKTHHVTQTWKKITTSFPLIYFVTNNMGCIKMEKNHGTSKILSKRQDFENLKISWFCLNYESQNVIGS